MPTDTSSWEKLGSVAPHDLVTARDAVHCAAQLTSLLAKILLPAADDWSHTALSWNAAERAMSTQLLPGRAPWVAMVPPERATVALVRQDGSVREEIPFPGQTPAAILAKLTRAAARAHGAPLPSSLEAAAEELPAPCRAGIAIATPDPHALTELTHYYHNAATILTRVQQAQPLASPVRTTPRKNGVKTTGCLLMALDSDSPPSTS